MADRNPHRKRGPYKEYEKIDPGVSHRFVQEVPPSTVASRLGKNQRVQGDVEDNITDFPLFPGLDEIDLTDLMDDGSGTDISNYEGSSDDEADTAPSRGESVEGPRQLTEGAGEDGGEEQRDGDEIGTLSEGNRTFRACSRKEYRAYRALKIYARHHCEDALLEDLLDFVNECIENPMEKLPKKAESFFHFVDQLVPSCNINRSYFCYDCYVVFGPEDNSCSGCGKGKTSVTSFFNLDVGQQIKTLFETGVITNELRPDLLDGSEFQRVKEILKGKHDLTLILNTDGLRVINSKKTECWPILLAIAELPEGLRNRCLLFGGLWFSKQKPIMNIFLEPLVDEMIRLYETGLRWTHPATRAEEITKIVVPLVIADCPGRADLLMFSHHSGTYGCQKCEIMTEPIYDSDGYLIGGRAYRFCEQPCQLRTHERIEQLAHIAEGFNGHIRIDKRKKNCGGVKGRSVLSRLPLINMGKAFVAELMHLVPLGSFSQFFEAWFFSSGTPYCISAYADEINFYMSQIKPPSFVHRLPRAVAEFKYFKASELLFWFLFYGIPILCYYLPEEYFLHFLLFVKGIYLLMLPKPGPYIDEAKRYLNRFVADVERLYGISFMTYNMHQLIHLAESAREFGSLARIWAFVFESFNYTIARSFHGTKDFGVQITKKISRVQQLLPLESKLAINDEDRSSRFGKMDEVRNYVLSDLDSEMIRSQGLTPSSIYRKLEMDGKIFTSKLYRDDVKNNDYTVQIFLQNSDVLGEIGFFFSDGDALYAYFSRFQCTQAFQNTAQNLTIDHVLHVVNRNSESVIIDLRNVRSIRHIVPVHDFVVLPPCPLYKTL